MRSFLNWLRAISETLFSRKGLRDIFDQTLEQERKNEIDDYYKMPTIEIFVDDRLLTPEEMRKRGIFFEYRGNYDNGDLPNKTRYS